MNTQSEPVSVLPLSALLVLWIALTCLVLPDFAIAAGPEPSHPVDSVSAVNPGSELWREIRQRQQPSEGISQVRGVDSGVLINPWGDRWARFRMNELVSYGGLLLIGFLLLILLFYAIRGRIRLAKGFCGDLLKRFSRYQVIVHWVMAGSFLFLGLTGLVLLFGRDFLIPVMGREAFSVVAGLSKDSHNLAGPLFLISLLMLFVALVRRNLYERGDLKWILTAAGTIGKSHPRIGFFNLGEKFLFWGVVGLGLVVSLSGLVLVTPIFGQGRVIMETSHLVHSIAALLLISVSFFHMYLGLYGVEGALDGMKDGYVDLNWARAHHDRWADECIESGQVVRGADQPGNATPAASSSA